MHSPPLIGITCDTAQPPEAHGLQSVGFKYESPSQYAQAVALAGGIPILLPYEPDHIPHYLNLCHGFILTGGDDPDTTPFGDPVHPKAKLLHPARQRFELALLSALDHTPHPVLGICLGMQLMALRAGGSLHQHLPDAPGFTDDAANLHADAPHPIRLTLDHHPHLPPHGQVHSKHHQAVAHPGTMRTIALSEPPTPGNSPAPGSAPAPGSPPVIEAIDAPHLDDRFYLGVQWHPERTADPALGQNIITHFVHACRNPSPI